MLIISLELRLSLGSRIFCVSLSWVNAYNKKAAKWGHELLSYNAETHTIIGKFTDKTEASDSKAGFWKVVKEEYQNGELEDAWKRIVKLCK